MGLVVLLRETKGRESVDRRDEPRMMHSDPQVLVVEEVCFQGPRDPRCGGVWRVAE